MSKRNRLLEKPTKNERLDDTDEKRIRRREMRSRRKRGHGFEREVAIMFRDVFPGARRHLEYHPADATGIDLINTGRYRIQCKRNHHYASLRAIEEVQCDEIMLGHTPVLVTQGDGLRVLCALPIEELIRLIRIAQSVSPDHVN